MGHAGRRQLQWTQGATDYGRRREWNRSRTRFATPQGRCRAAQYWAARHLSVLVHSQPAAADIVTPCDVARIRRRGRERGGGGVGVRGDESVPLKSGVPPTRLAASLPDFDSRSSCCFFLSLSLLLLALSFFQSRTSSTSSRQLEPSIRVKKCGR